MQKFLLTRPRRPIDLPGTIRPQVSIWIHSSHEDEDGELCFEGDAELFEKVQSALFNSYGMRARPLDGPMTPVDLAVALGGRLMKAFEPQELS